MKKKWILIVIGLLLVVGIGGKVYMDTQAEKKEAEKIEAERMSVVALKNTFSDIKSVEIEKSSYNVMTGSHSIFVKMRNKNDKEVKFRYTFWEKEKELGTIGIEDREIQVEGKTTDKVKVIYSNDEVGEI